MTRYEIFDVQERRRQEYVANEHAQSALSYGREWSCYCIQGCAPARARGYAPRVVAVAAVSENNC